MPGEQAPAAAERAAEAIFAYDYRTLPADLKRAEPYLTASFDKEFTKNFTLLEKQKDGAPGLAVQTKSWSSPPSRPPAWSTPRTDVARVLVYVNLTSTRPDQQPADLPEPGDHEDGQGGRQVAGGQGGHLLTRTVRCYSYGAGTG